MKTNKFFYIAALAGMLTTGIQKIHAQGFMLNAGLGYGMNAVSSMLGDEQTIPSSGGTSHKLVKGSFGSGLNFGIGAGYMFNENIGAEIGFNYLMGSKTTITSTDASSSPTVTNKDVWSAKMIRIIPSIVITAGDGKIRPYAKVGLVMGMGGKLTDDATSTDGTNNAEQVDEYTGGTAIGFASSLGIHIGLSDNLMIFGELGMVGQAWAPKKDMVTKSTLNGTDVLGTMTTSQKETDFSDSYTDPTSPNPGAPSQSLKFYVPMSSFGVNVGIHMAFGGK